MGGHHEHSHATEGLIVVSQTVFFVFLFIFLKKSLIDNRGMMSSRSQLNENSLQLVAIFFAIFVFLGVLMLPLIHYEYAEVVVILTASVVAVLVAHDLRKILKDDNVTAPRQSGPRKLSRQPTQPSQPSPSPGPGPSAPVTSLEF
jgi:hypothetical protein